MAALLHLSALPMAIPARGVTAKRSSALRPAAGRRAGIVVQAKVLDLSLLPVRCLWRPYNSARDQQLTLDKCLLARQTLWEQCRELLTAELCLAS